MPEDENQKGIARREFIKNAAVLGTIASSSDAMVNLVRAEQPQEAGISLETFNSYGTDLEKLLSLRTYPIAIKFLKSEAEIPQGAVRPKKDRGEHYAMCQAFAVARRQGMTLAMFIEDHWCFEPVREACPRNDAHTVPEICRNGIWAVKDGEVYPGHYDDLFQYRAVEASSSVVEIQQGDAGDFHHRSNRFLRSFRRAFVAEWRMPGDGSGSRRLRARDGSRG
jgi:hypothetical protein